MLTIISIFILLNLLYWLFIFNKLSHYYQHQYNNKPPATHLISKTAIVIAVKNEEQNIKKNLLSFLNQKPSGYKLVLVDDYSKDNTLHIIDNYSQQYPYLKVLKNKYESGKKYALSYATQNIEEKYLLFTDADCYVKSENWLVKMTSLFNNQVKIILGYSPYTGKTFLSKFIRFETFMTAVQYFSYAILGIPYMGVGRNIAIDKAFFIKNKGYESNFDIKSGSDDLFVNENANARNTAIQIDPDTFVYSTPAKTLNEFIKQKTRHISTSFRYKIIHKILLALYSLSHIGVYLLLIVGIFFLPLKLVIILWLLRIIIILTVSYRSFVLLKEKDLFIWLPILDFLMFVYYFYMGVYYFFADKNKWK